MYEDDPQDLVFDLLGEAVFGSHPLGRPVIGRAEVVAATTREQLAAFHDRALPPRHDRDRRRRVGRPRRARRAGPGLRPIAAEPAAASASDAGASDATLSRTPRQPRRRPCRPSSARARVPAEGHRAVPRLRRGRGPGPRGRAPLRAAGARRDPRRAPRPRACSRRSASAGAWPTRCSRSRTSTPTPARSGLYVGTRPDKLAEALAVVAARSSSAAWRTPPARRSWCARARTSRGGWCSRWSPPARV